MLQEQDETEQALKAVRRALEDLKFGSVEVAVHEGKVVQIERKEKVRLNAGVKSKG